MSYLKLSPEERKTMLKNAQQMTSNHLSRSMARFLNKYTDPRRDINKECGFPTTGEITPEHYRDMFDRSGYASRVVSAWADEAWKVAPKLYEEKVDEPTTEFERSWLELPKYLSVEGESFFDSESDFDVWHYLKEAQIHAGIGHFGCLLLGLDDGRDLSQPVKGFRDNTPTPYIEPEKEREVRLRYMRVFDETSVNILRWETNPKSPRYGYPIEYQLTMYDSSYWTTTPTSLHTQTVHWSRIIHLNDGKGTNVLFSPPRQLPVWNNLLSLNKVIPGSAEMFWKGAFMGFALKLMNGYEVDDNAASEEEVRESMELYQRGQQRFLGIPGWDIEELSPQVSDPGPHVDVQVDEICVCIEMPKKTFLGSTDGVSAGDQDRLNWNERVHGFRFDTCVPQYVVPVVNRLILCKVLKKPTKGLKTNWSDGEQVSAKDRTEINRKRVQACQMYIMSGTVKLIPPDIFVTKFLGIERHEADKWIKKIDEEWLHLKAESTVEIQTEDEDDNDESSEGKDESDGLNLPPDEKKNQQSKEKYAQSGKNPLPSTKRAVRPENS